MAGAVPSTLRMLTHLIFVQLYDVGTTIPIYSQGNRGTGSSHLIKISQLLYGRSNNQVQN